MTHIYQVVCTCQCELTKKKEDTKQISNMHLLQQVEPPTPVFFNKTSQQTHLEARNKTKTAPSLHLM